MTEVPSLFDTGEAVREQAERKTGPAGIAQNFVRWCCSFGDDFRNSPDRGNLKTWAESEDVAYKPAEEPRILDAARERYRKRVATVLRKASRKAA